MKVGQSKLAVSAMDKTYHEYSDHGASFYLQYTRPVASFPNYHYWGDLAKYIYMFAPNLRVLAGFAHSIYNLNRRRLLVRIQCHESRISRQSIAQSNRKSECRCGPTPQPSVKLSGEFTDRDSKDDLQIGVLCRSNYQSDRAIVP